MLESGGGSDGLVHELMRKETKSTRLPHVRRSMSERHPHHVVLTLRPGVPSPRCGSVHQILLHWIREVQRRYGVAISLACSMHDHVHLLVETPRGAANLGETMRFFSSKLALAINNRWSRRGPVLRDRYFSRPLRTLSELVRAVRYVAMNPVKARLARRPEDDPAPAVHDYLSGNLPASPWRTRGWMYQKLGFLDDPRQALRDILDGT